MGGRDLLTFFETLLGGAGGCLGAGGVSKFWVALSVAVLGWTLLLPSVVRGQVVTGDFEARSVQGGTVVQVELRSGSLSASAATLGFTGRILREGSLLEFPTASVLTRRVGQSVWDYEAAGIHGLPALRLKYDSDAGSLQVAFGVSTSELWVEARRAYRLAPGSSVPGSYVFAYRLDGSNPLVSTGSLDAQMAALTKEAPGLSAGSAAAGLVLKLHGDFQGEIDKVQMARATAVGNLQKAFQSAGATAGGSLQMAAVGGVVVENFFWNFKNPFEGDGNTYVTKLLKSVTDAKTGGDLSRAYFEAGLSEVEDLYPNTFSEKAKLDLAKNVVKEMESYRLALGSYRIKALAYRSALVTQATARESARSTAKSVLTGTLQSSPLKLSGPAEVAENLLTSVELYLNEAVGESQGTQGNGLLWVSDLEARVGSKVDDLGGRLVAGMSAVLGKSDAEWEQQVISGFQEWSDGVWVAIQESLPESYSIANVKDLVARVFPRLKSYLEVYREAVLKALDQPVSSEDLKSIDEFQWIEPGNLGPESYVRLKALFDIRAAQRAGNDRAQRTIQFNRDVLRNFQGYGWAALRFGTLKAGDPRLVAEISGVSPAGVAWQANSLVRVDASGQEGWVALNLTSGTGSASPGSSAGSVGSASALPSLTGVIPLSVGTLSGGSLSVTLGGAGANPVLEWNGMPCVLEGPLPIRVNSGTASTANILGQSEAVQVVMGVEDPGQKTSVVGFGARVDVAAPGREVTPVLRIAPSGSEMRVVMGSLSGSVPVGGVLAQAGRFYGKYPVNPGSGTAVFQGVLMPSGEASKPLGFGFLQTGSSSSLVVKLTQPEPSAVEIDPVAPVIAGPVVGWKGVNSSVFTLNVGTAAAVNRTTVQLLRGGALVAGGTAIADGKGEVRIPLAGVSSGSYQVRVLREFLTKESPKVDSGSFTVVQRSAAGTFQSLLSYPEPFEAGVGSPNGNPYRARLTVSATDTGALSGKLELIDLKPVLDEDKQPAPAWVADPTLFPTTSPAPVEGGSVGLGNPSPVSFQTRLPAVLSYTLSSGALMWETSKTSLVSGEVFPEDGLAMTLPVLTSSKLNTGHQLRLYLRQDVLDTPVDPARTVNSPIPRLDMALVLSGSATAGGGSLLLGSSVSTVTASGIAKGLGSYATAGTEWAWLKLRSNYSWNVSGTSARYTWKRGSISKTGSANLGADGSIPFFLLMDGIESPKLGTTSLKTTAVGMMEARLTLKTPVQNPAAPVYELVADSPLYVTGTTLDTVGGYKKSWLSSLQGLAPGTYLGLSPGGFGWAERMLTRTLPKVQALSGRVEVGKDYELRVENTRTGQSATLTVRGSGTIPSGASAGAFPATVSLAEVPSGPTTSGVVLTNFKVTNSTGAFSGTLKAPGSTTTGTVSGNYVRDDWATDSKLVARGVSSDAAGVVWSLYRK